MTEFIRPTIRALVRDGVANFEADSIYGMARSQLEAEIEQRLREAFDGEALLLADFLIREMTFTEAFNDALIGRLVAEQELETARIQADIAIIQAEAEASALEILSPLIQDNPLLIYVLYIRALEHGGEVPDELFFELGLDEGMLSIPEVGD